MPAYELVAHEIFTGEETGRTNITMLRKWLVEQKRPIEKRGFMMANALSLLEHHAWDDSFEKRIASLSKMKEPDPLIVTTMPDLPIGVYVIDGWHRLAIYYKVCLQMKSPVCPFTCYIVTPEDLKRFPVAAEGVIPLGEVSYDDAVKRGAFVRK